MFFMYLCIVLSSALQSVSTKLYGKQGAPSSIFNFYKALTALLIFCLLSVRSFDFHLPSLLCGLVYGLLLSLSMLYGYRALCTGPMAITSMLVSFSVVLPLLYGIFFGGEIVNALHFIAFIMLIFAICFSVLDKLRAQGKAFSASRGWLFYVFSTFLCNGLCSILQKQHQTWYPGAYSSEFMLCAMLLCTMIFALAARRTLSFSALLRAPHKGMGLLSGAANASVSYLTLLLAGQENATVLFPLISAGTLLSSILCGRFIFREKLRITHYLALLLGMLAVVLLKL